MKKEAQIMIKENRKLHANPIKSCHHTGNLAIFFILSLLSAESKDHSILSKMIFLYPFEGN